MSIKYYKTNGLYTKNCPASFLAKFDKSKDIKQILSDVFDYFDPAKHYVTTTTDYRLSRFLPVSRIIRRRLRTCGAICAVDACVLRHLGHAVKLIDGRVWTKEKSIRHAWLEIYIPKFKKFVGFDSFGIDFKLKPRRKKYGEYRDWSEFEKIGNHEKNKKR